MPLMRTMPMVLLAMLAIACKESKEDHARIERMLSSQVFQLSDDVKELEDKIKMVEGLGSSDEDKERRGYICDDLPGQRETLMNKWDAFLWDRISLSMGGKATWAVETFPKEGEQLEELGDRLTVTYDRMQLACRK